jgi:hypothetical protein
LVAFNLVPSYNSKTCIYSWLAMKNALTTVMSC